MHEIGHCGMLAKDRFATEGRNMRLNMYMLLDRLKERGLELSHSFIDSRESLISAVPRLYREGETLTSDAVWVADAASLPENPSTEGHPSLVCLGEPSERYRAFPFNALWASEKQIEDGLLGLFSQVVDACDELFSWQDELQRLVNEKRPPRELGEASFGIFGNPIAMMGSGLRCTFDFRPPVTEDSGEAYRAYFEKYPTSEGEYLSSDEASILLEQQVFTGTGEGLGPGLYSDPDGFFGYQTLYCNLGKHGEYLAKVSVDGVLRPISDGDWGAIQVLGHYLLESISDAESGAMSRDFRMERMLDHLLNGEPADENDVTWSLKNLGWKAEDHLVCLMVRPVRKDVNPEVLRTLANQFLHQIPTSCLYVLDDSIAYVINLTQVRKTREELCEGLSSSLATFGAIAGMSVAFSNIRLLSSFSAQARSALSLGGEGAKPGGVLCYEYFNLAAMLDAVRTSMDPETICPPGLLRLAQHDMKHHTGYVQLLRTYLELDMNGAETSRVLHLHRNTLLYQLKRIREISDLNLDDPRTRLELLIVLNVLEA